MVGQWLVQVVAQRVADTQTVSSDALKLALRAPAFEEHDEVELLNTTGSMDGRPKAE
jgi:hypothetical protein